MEAFSRITLAMIATFFLGRSIQRLSPPQPQRLKRWAIFLLLYTTHMMPSWVGDENPLLLFPFFIAVCLFCLTGEWLQRLVISGIFYTLLISLNMLFDTKLYEKDLIFLVGVLMKQMAWCLLAWFLCRIVPKGGLQLSRKLWLLLGGLMLAPLGAMLSFSIWGYWMVLDVQYDIYLMALRRLASTTLPLALVSALALLLASVVLCKHEALERENSLAALREIYYTGLRQEQQQLRILRHDLRNHVSALQGLLEQGQRAAAQQYLQTLTDSPAFSGGQRYAENEAANAVLSSKAAQMQQTQLTPDFAVSLPESISLSAPELCALLGNALDNAIKGAEGAEDGVIHLKARIEKGMFMLQVKNAVGGAVNPDLSTTKPDRAHHGLGIPSMRDIANRHGGTLETQCNGNQFELVVCFPCEAQN